MEGDTSKCLEAGMDDYLAKPVTQAMLAATLSRWLGHDPLQLAAQTPDAGPAVSLTAVAENDTDTGDSDTDAFDSTSVMERLGGDQPLITAVIASFTQRTPEILQDLQAALQIQDAECAARQLHSLLGASAAVSANAVNALVRSMEQWLKLGDGTRVQQALPGLARKLEAFARAAARAGFKT